MLTVEIQKDIQKKYSIIIIMNTNCEHPMLSTVHESLITQ